MVHETSGGDYKKVVLCCPNVHRSPIIDNKLFSLGLLYLHNAARKANFKSIIVDAYFQELTPEETISEILKEGIPSLYGFMVHSQEMLESVKSIIHKPPRKNKGKIIPVVLGGVYPSMQYKGLMENNPKIDFIVRGEGEECLRELLEAICRSYPFNGIKGLSYRGPDKKIYHNADRKLRDNLDEYGSYDLDYIRDIIPSASWTISSSRGCSGRCSFCLVGHHFGKKGLWRGHSAGWVVGHLEEMVRKFKASHIKFVDDEFVGSEASIERAIEIVELIRKRKFSPKFSIMCRPDTVRKYPSIFELLKSVGLVNVFLGIESGNNEVLEHLIKRSVVEDAIEAVSILENLNINIQGGNIIFHPWMTEQTVLQDIDFFQDLFLKHRNFVFFTLNGVEIFRGTELGKCFNGPSHEWQIGWKASDEKMQTIYTLWLRIERTILLPALTNITITPMVRKNLCLLQLRALKELISGFRSSKSYPEEAMFKAFMEMCNFLYVNGGKEALKGFLSQRSMPHDEKELCFERHY